jgi:hypothetical protein
MAPKTLPKEPKLDDTARFEAWLTDFDAKMAALTARQDALLRSLGVEPVRHKSTVPPETV